MTTVAPLKGTFGAPETMYCAEQIRIPSELPEILKNYTKYVIKNQPSDIIAASAEYFGRLAKQRSKTSAGSKKMTNQQLEAIYRKPSFSRKEIEQISADAPQGQVYDVLALGGWSDSDIPWVKYFALLAAANAGVCILIDEQTIHATIETICEILGDNGQIPASPLLEMFAYLAERDHSIPSSVSSKFVKSMQERGENLEINALVETMKAEIPQKFDIAPVAAAPVAAPVRPISTFSAAPSSAGISTPGAVEGLKSQASNAEFTATTEQPAETVNQPPAQESDHTAPESAAVEVTTEEAITAVEASKELAETAIEGSAPAQDKSAPVASEVPAQEELSAPVTEEVTVPEPQEPSVPKAEPIVEPVAEATAEETVELPVAEASAEPPVDQLSS